MVRWEGRAQRQVWIGNRTLKRKNQSDRFWHWSISRFGEVIKPLKLHVPHEWPTTEQTDTLNCPSPNAVMTQNLPGSDPSTHQEIWAGRTYMGHDLIRSATVLLPLFARRTKLYSNSATLVWASSVIWILLRGDSLRWLPTFLTLWGRGALPRHNATTPEVSGRWAAGFSGWRADHPAGDSVLRAVLPEGFKRNKQLLFPYGLIHSVYQSAAQIAVLLWKQWSLTSQKIIYEYFLSLLFLSTCLFFPPSLFFLALFLPLFSFSLFLSFLIYFSSFLPSLCLFWTLLCG